MYKITDWYITMMIDVRERDERVLDLEFLGFLWHTVTQRRSETYPFYKDFTVFSHVFVV